MIYKYFNIIALSLVVVLSACKDGPKVIANTVGDDNTIGSSSTGIFSDNPSDPNTSSVNISNDVHNVVALEVLPTDKYVYVRVKEKEEEYWVATSKMEVKIGETYFYKNGLLKTNFESKEYKRTFDKVYLVGTLVSANHGSQMTATINESGKDEKLREPRSINVKGSVKISEIIANPKKYEGKEVTISGECVKINPNIMGRNWLHLKDGSKDDYDFVVTSDKAIPQGHVVTMKGIVSLDKDFGAGYKYDIIVENALLVN